MQVQRSQYEDAQTGGSSGPSMAKGEIGPTGINKPHKSGSLQNIVN